MLSFLLLLVSRHKHCRTIGNVSFEMNSTHRHSGSMFVNHTDVRMARTKIRGGLNLVYNLYEMDGWKRSQISRLIGGRALTLFCLPLAVDVPLSSCHVEAVHISKRRNAKSRTTSRKGRRQYISLITSGFTPAMVRK